MSLAVRIWMAFVLALMLAGCERLTPEEKVFVELTYGEQTAAVLRAEPDKRLDLFLLAYRMVPPNVGAKNALADLGADIVPLVLDRLRDSDDRTTRNFVDLLIAMEIQQNYCVSCDADTMARIREAVHRIRNDTSRTEYVRKVKYFLEDNSQGMKNQQP
jgi:hypothetical protein